MKPARVVITGLGMVSPLAVGAEESWARALEGASGVGPITRFDASLLRTKIAAEVKRFEPALFLDKKSLRTMDLFSQFAMVSAEMAVQDAHLNLSELTAERAGCLMGVGLGGLIEIEDMHKRMLSEGPLRISPFFIPKSIINIASGQISIRYGLKGPNFGVVSACASSAHAIGEAARYVAGGLCDVMIAGGSEATITPLCVGGFNAARALSERNEEPEKASRPFDAGRDGFVCGEGGGVLVLESLDHAVKRGARIYAELAGYGASSDAHHITAPPDDGDGGRRAMELALKDAGLRPSEIDYVNAHGTSTPQGDIAETRAIKRVFGDHARRLMVSSTKSMTGHMLGAAGITELIFCVLSIRDGRVPPTINLEIPDPECDLDYVPNSARSAKVKAALSNSFGFGGTNATLIVREFEA